MRRGAVERFYVGLSYILRRYIEERFFIRALEMTTTELLYEMDDEGLTQQPVEWLEQVLVESDLVKFAALVPTRVGGDAAFERARQFVLRTMRLREADDAESSEQTRGESGSSTR